MTISSHTISFTVVITVDPMSVLFLYHYFGDHENLYIPSSFFYFSYVIDNAKPACLNCGNNNIYSFILSLLNILFYELSVLYIFDINNVWPCDIYKFIWFLIWQTSTTRKPHGDKIEIFAWQWYYFEYVGDSEILK